MYMLLKQPLLTEPGMIDHACNISQEAFSSAAAPFKLQASFASCICPPSTMLPASLLLGGVHMQHLHGVSGHC